jgi:hypothetical protein
VGDAHTLVAQPERVSHRPFALFIADPEPHTIIGTDTAAGTMDLQKVKSMIWRGSLDSLSLSITPRTEVVEGQVNIADALNTEIGALIRVRQPGMIREVRHSFVGADTLPMLEYADRVKEDRFGRSRASQGLDPDVLQSTTKSGVDATVTASQKESALLARRLSST